MIFRVLTKRIFSWWPSSLMTSRFMTLSLLTLSLVTLSLAGSRLVADEPYRPTPGKFPVLEKAKFYRGELVFVDHVNRRGSLRLHVDGHFHEGRLHHFAMLPYGMIWYRGAPAELRDIPIGTVLYGRFFLPPDPKTSVVPVVRQTHVTSPKENHAILLEDGPSYCLRQQKKWKLKNLKLDGNAGILTASLKKGNSAGFGGEHSLTIDGSTRIWRGKELLGLDDLVKEQTWPSQGKLELGEQPAHLALAWHPRYLYQQFHVSDIWLDEAAIKVASERQRQKHLRHIRTRWMPAMVDSVDHGKFGQATVKVILFAGMDPSLYQDFAAGKRGKMAAAETTLRTWWPDHDGMDGKIVEVKKSPADPQTGNSGIEVSFEVALVLEGFRPGRIVRLRPQDWPNVKPPVEERVRGLEDRFPSLDIFKR